MRSERGGVARAASARLVKFRTRALGRALGLRSASLVRVLSGLGLDATCAPLMTWIPAIELVWVVGLSARERESLLRLLYERHGVLGARAEVLLYEWLANRPPDVVFRTARRVLCAQLASLPPRERPALRARITGPCAALVGLSGRPLAHTEDADDAYVWLLTLVDTLLLPEDEAFIPDGAFS